MTERVERRLAAILSADVVGYTRLMHGDEEGTLARLHAQIDELAVPKISEWGGRIVKRMGDGLLVEFRSVVDAVRCATEIQRGAVARNAGVAEDRRIVFRIGINLGDVIVEGDDIYGDGVNVATRMQEIAAPGGVSVSGVVYDSVKDKLAPAFEDLGPQQVKNLAEPVRAYRVVLEPEAAAKPPRDRRGPAPAASAVRTGAVRTSAVRKGQVLAILSSSRRGGTWRVPARLSVLCVMGSIDLDFREAEFGPGVTELQVTNVMGSVAIIAPTRLPVVCDGVGILGQFDGLVSGAGDPPPGASQLRIGGVAVMGHTTVS